MNKDSLLFYSAYENFYNMVQNSECFKKYCIKAFGEDFSQDGFSDINQISLILEYAPKKENINILDIGCGNGKMLEYLQSKIGGHIYGFDFSENAINTAKSMNIKNSNFKCSIIGEADYPLETFDLITSMDTMYFTKDMPEFTKQIYSWLKHDSVFFIGYEEGDIMPKTSDSDTTVIADALRKSGFKYSAINYTKETYDMLKTKREAVISLKDDFIRENLQQWYDVVLGQTQNSSLSFDEYQNFNARYIYIARK